MFEVSQGLTAPLPMGTPSLAPSLLPAPPFLYIIPLYPPSLPTLSPSVSDETRGNSGRVGTGGLRKHARVLPGLKNKALFAGETHL